MEWQPTGSKGVPLPTRPDSTVHHESVFDPQARMPNQIVASSPKCARRPLIGPIAFADNNNHVDSKTFPSQASSGFKTQLTGSTSKVSAIHSYYTRQNDRQASASKVTSAGKLLLVALSILVVAAAAVATLFIWHQSYRPDTSRLIEERQIASKHYLPTPSLSTFAADRSDAVEMNLSTFADEEAPSNVDGIRVKQPISVIRADNPLKELRQLIRDSDQQHDRTLKSEIERLNRDWQTQLDAVRATFHDQVQQLEQALQRVSSECSASSERRPSTDDSSTVAHVQSPRDDTELSVRAQQWIEQQLQESHNQTLKKCEDVCQAKLTRYDADKIGRANHLSEMAGAHIRHSSPTFEGKHVRINLFGLFAYRMYSKPDHLIEDHPLHWNRAWFMAGTEGFVEIELNRPLLADYLIYEHMPRSLATRKEQLTCVPKKFLIRGYDAAPVPFAGAHFDPKLGNRYDLGDFVFQLPAAASNQFSIEKFQLRRLLNGNQPLPIKFIRISVLDNYGNSEYTCLHKLRLTGTSL
jgi:hypothetical protein